jgi:hypothetical protein
MVKDFDGRRFVGCITGEECDGMDRCPRWMNCLLYQTVFDVLFEDAVNDGRTYHPF